MHRCRPSSREMIQGPYTVARGLRKGGEAAKIPARYISNLYYVPNGNKIKNKPEHSRLGVNSVKLSCTGVFRARI